MNSPPTSNAVTIPLPDWKTTGIVICVGIVGFLYYNHMVLNAELKQTQRVAKGLTERVYDLERFRTMVNEADAMANEAAAEYEQQQQQQQQRNNAAPPRLGVAVNTTNNKTPEPRQQAQFLPNNNNTSRLSAAFSTTPDSGVVNPCFDDGVALDSETQKRINDIIKSRTGGT